MIAFNRMAPSPCSIHWLVGSFSDVTLMSLAITLSGKFEPNLDFLFDHVVSGLRSQRNLSYSFYQLHNTASINKQLKTNSTRLQRRLINSNNQNKNSDIHQCPICVINTVPFPTPSLLLPLPLPFSSRSFNPARGALLGPPGPTNDVVHI